MRHHEDNVEEVLKHSLPSASREQAEAAAGRVFQRLQSDPDAQPDPGVINLSPARRIPWRWMPAMAAAAALIIAAIWGGIHWQRPRAIGMLATGQRIEAQEVVRSNDVATTLSLSDGTRVEMRPRSELWLEPANDGIRIRLEEGGLIVNSPKQKAGRHLYVQTKDVIVSVVGTVFLVNAEEEGSRVAVIEGEVRVQQRGAEKKLLSGEQLTTSVEMPAALVRQQISWSQNAAAHAALLAQSAPVQTQETLRPADIPKWEAVSIRPCAGGGEPGARGGGGGGQAVGGGVRIEPGLLRVTCMRLRYLIEDAYVKYLEPEILRRRWIFPVEGGPSWVDSELYTIEAKPEGAPGTQIVGGPMLQALLEDRFKLKIRREIREEDVYELRVADSGFKLKPLNEGECNRPGPDPEKAKSEFERLAALNYARCGSVRIGAPSDGSTAPPNSRTVNLDGMPVVELTNYLSLGRVILDKTGIKGVYDIRITYAREPEPNPEVTGVAPEPSGADPVFVAIQKQLGLKLVPTKGPRTYYFIEYVERPTPN